MPRKHHFNERFFASIQSEPQAYWLGFLTADGCLEHSPRPDTGVMRYGLHLRLAAADRPHVEAFARAVGYSGPVRRVDVSERECRGQKISASVAADCTLYSRLMVQDLLALGLRPDKSFVATAWEGPEPLLPHYWRGVVDGDGCLWKSFHKSRWKGVVTEYVQWAVSCCGSLAMMRALAAFVGRRLGHEAKPYPSSSIWAVDYSGTHLPKRVARLLYEEAVVFLSRKKVLADELIGSDFPERRWADLTAGELLQLLKRHGSWNAVGRHLGAPQGVLCAIRKRLGLVVARQGPKKSWAYLLNDDLEALYCLHGEWKKVAAVIGMKPPKLSQLLDRRGIILGRR